MKLEWTEPALSDLEGIRDYIKRDSEYYANRFVERIIETVEGLEQFPEMGRMVPEAEAENIRELLFHNYRIIYRLETDSILILTVIHSARDLARSSMSKNSANFFSPFDAFSLKNFCVISSFTILANLKNGWGYNIIS